MVRVQGTGTVVVPVLETARLRTATLPAVEAIGLPMETPTEQATLQTRPVRLPASGQCTLDAGCLAAQCLAKHHHGSCGMLVAACAGEPDAAYSMQARWVTFMRLQLMIHGPAVLPADQLRGKHRGQQAMGSILGVGRRWGEGGAGALGCGGWGGSCGGWGGCYWG